MVARRLPTAQTAGDARVSRGGAESIEGDALRGLQPIRREMDCGARGVMLDFPASRRAGCARRDYRCVAARACRAWSSSRPRGLTAPGSSECRIRLREDAWRKSAKDA